MREEDGRDFFQPYFISCAQEEVDEKTDETRPRGRRFHTVSCQK